MKRKVWAAFLSVTLVVGMLFPTTSPLAAKGIPPSPAPLPGGTLDPLTIPKYASALVKPAAMPVTTSSKNLDYYEIAAREFQQQILPAPLPKTPVFGYGSALDLTSFSYPARTIEATVNKPVRVKWINQLMDGAGNYLPPLLPIDQTLHWANPPGGIQGRDMEGTSQQPYAGPVPLVTHLHGAHVSEESDGFPTAWTLPNAVNIPDGYARVGSLYNQLKAEAQAKYGQAWTPGNSVYQYSNDQRAATLWYHDHALGITRANVYSGLAGFYLLRGGASDLASGLPSGNYELPLLIQDRSFNADGSLFYPGDRAFFEGLTTDQFQIPLAPSLTPLDEQSDISPIWNPEFFGNTMVVNGQTWPYQNVEQKRYRLRLLNGSDSRFLILKLSNGGSFWQIGADGGLLPAPVKLNSLLIAPAERMDVIVDFTGVKVGTRIILQNLAPDEPFGGGLPGVDFAASNPDTTGQVMQFRVVASSTKDTSTAPGSLHLPALTKLGAADNSPVMVSLNEKESATVFASFDADGNLVFDPNGEPWAPSEAALGTLDADGNGVPMEFMDPVTEQPQLNHTEMWEIRNFTEDAHPIHLHLVQFEVISRTDANGVTTGPEPGESGTKDTVIVYPGDGVNPGITRIKAKFDIAGMYLWHCHILSHEDNEMMRPYQVVP